MRFATIAFFVTSLASVALSITEQQMTLLQKHFNTLQSRLDAVNEAFTSFPNSGGTVMQAMAVGWAGIAHVKSVETATDDLNAMPVFDSSNMLTLLAIAEPLLSAVEQAIQAFIDREQSFDQLKATPLLKAGMAYMVQASNGFADSIVAHASPETQARTTALADKFKASWNRVTDVYA